MTAGVRGCEQVHEGQDDLGRGCYPDSNTTGHAGARMGCCVITIDIMNNNIIHDVYGYHRRQHKPMSCTRAVRRILLPPIIPSRCCHHSADILAVNRRRT